MRIPIREQLALLLLLASAIGLGVISVATWITNYRFVLNVQSSALSIAASLKASQLASNLALIENSAQFLASRVLVQQSLQQYNDNGNNSAGHWTAAGADMQAAIGGPVSRGAVGNNLLLQSQILGASDNGPAGSTSLINTTSSQVAGNIQLPYNYPNGTPVFLGDDGLGYPSNLYPNFTYFNVTGDDGQLVLAASYDGAVLSPARNQALLLGPWQVNSTFAMLSITIPMVNNTNANDVLGWLTVLVDARLITEVIAMPQGLGSTGDMLLVRPVNATNQYPPSIRYDDGPNPTIFDDTQVQFVLPLAANESSRHPGRILGTDNPPFNMSQFPAIVSAVTVNNDAINNAKSAVKSHNEAGKAVSVGYALVENPFVDWAVVVELARSEVFSSTNNLRKVILACFFATLGAMILVSWPLAHFSTQPIRALHEATMKSVNPSEYGDTDGASAMGWSQEHNEDELQLAQSSDQAEPDKEDEKSGWLAAVIGKRKRTQSWRNGAITRRQFRIPGKVPDRKHLVKDELSELTTTFNDMSDELMTQYGRLEERVQRRTAELELSKKAAEAANESKTLFIANISHELKTPLNGILGMCAVCMQEDDPSRLKRSLGIIYKSGDLLLNLLTDLLTFSKNQVGQQLSLDEKEFRLDDIGSQILAIFDKQANEGQINLRVLFTTGEEGDTLGSVDDVISSRVKNMVVWGDIHRILQVTINLVSNSLKFTPPNGDVTLTVRCLGEAPDIGSRKTSLGSRTSKKTSTRQAYSNALSMAFRRANSDESAKGVRGETPPPHPQGSNMLFEFEVTDTGPGIPQDSHKKIFEPFVQGDLGLSKKYGGTGLGLSICSQLAGLMHGAMSLKSEVGKGSTFAMRIPLRYLLSRADSTASATPSISGDVTPVQTESGRSPLPDNATKGSTQPDGITNESPSKPPPSSPSAAKHSAPYEASQPRLVGLSQPFFATAQPMSNPPSQSGAMEQITATALGGSRIRVLVAEDNAVNQEVVLRMLKLEEIYDVTVAKDGQEALDLVKESMGFGSQPSQSRRPFNLIFMDVQMPNLDGLQSTKLIRECGFNAPIVALTAFAEESNVKDCMESGMNYFLSKPIRRPALKKVLKEYCAPIPEVNEEAHTTPDPRARPGAGHKASASMSTRNDKDLRLNPAEVDNSGNGTTVIVMNNSPRMSGETKR